MSLAYIERDISSTSIRFWLSSKLGRVFDCQLGPASATQAIAQAKPFLNADQKAANLYKQGEYEQAKNLFTDPSWQGAASYQTGDYEAAI
ncbi:hypothetical protein J8A10_24150, partial [Vibrio parahaemolyticus]|nr:hypothetical protein [Vibrio parahaemolyticus]